MRRGSKRRGASVDVGLVIDRKFGDYVLLRRLAIGGQSEVFLAMKVGPGAFHRPLVIKALPSRYRHDPDFVRLFHKEAFISSRFAHPHVVTVHDAKLIEDDYCMVMDFVSGQTLLDVAQRGFQAGSPPKLTHVVRIIADACDGLSYVHDFRDLDGRRYEVVHRDVSPQNLMVTYQGVCKVFDFGIAQIRGKEPGDEREDVLAGGKYAYMSPEQCRGEEVDPRSDIFSLGIILYELATGYRLFRRRTQAEIIDAVCSESIQPPRQLREDLPMYLEQCIMKALERDPDQRYQSAGQMRDHLEEYLTMVGATTVRGELSRYLLDLFADERKQTAAALRQVDPEALSLQPLAGTPLEQVGKDFQPVEEVTQDLEVPMPPPNPGGDPVEDAQARLDAVRQQIEQEGEPEQGAPEPIPRQAAVGASEPVMNQDLERLERRQRILLVALGFVTLVALVLGLSQIQASPASSVEAHEAPAAINSSPP